MGIEPDDPKARSLEVFQRPDKISRPDHRHYLCGARCRFCHGAGSLRRVPVGDDDRAGAERRGGPKDGAHILGVSDLIERVRLEKQSELAAEFDQIHSVERAQRVGSLDGILAARRLRPFLINRLERAGTEEE